MNSVPMKLSGDGEEISATSVTIPAYRKVAGINACNLPTTSGGDGTTF